MICDNALNARTATFSGPSLTRRIAGIAFGLFLSLDLSIFLFLFKPRQFLTLGLFLRCLCGKFPLDCFEARSFGCSGILDRLPGGTRLDYGLTLFLARFVFGMSGSRLGTEALEKRLFCVRCRTLAVVKFRVSKAHTYSVP